MRSSTRTVAAVLMAASTLLSVSGASAQSAASPQAPSGSLNRSARPPSVANAPPIPDQKLDAAAAAIARVAFLRQNYERQLAQADPADRPEIANQAQGALTQAVKDQGLSVDEYNSIVERAQADPTVRQKILDRLRPPPSEAPSGGSSPSGR